MPMRNDGIKTNINFVRKVVDGKQISIIRTFLQISGRGEGTLFIVLYTINQHKPVIVLGRNMKTPTLYQDSVHCFDVCFDYRAISPDTVFKIC